MIDELKLIETRGIKSEEKKAELDEIEKGLGCHIIELMAMCWAIHDIKNGKISLSMPSRRSKK